MAAPYSTWKERHALSALRVLAWLALAAGVILRLWFWIDNRSLFIDEANLALNISELSFPAFFQPLQYQQYAPPLFLCLEKAAVLTFGSHEWALRVLPTLGGLAMLAFFFFLIRRLKVSPWVQWYPLLMLSLSPFLLRFGTEAKQYSTDAALALLLILACLHYSERSFRFFHAAAWSLGGALAIWASMPSIFILAGVGAFYAYRSLTDNDRAGLAFLLPCALVWLASFALLYTSVINVAMQENRLLDYHQPYFLPLDLWEQDSQKQMGSILYGLLRPLIGYTVVGFLTGTFMLLGGAYHLLRHRPGVGLLLLVPILAAFAASATGRFSLIPRVSMFMMPLLMVLVACGASALWQRGGAYLRALLLVLFLLEAIPFLNSFAYLREGTEIEDLKTVLLHLRASDGNGDVILDTEACGAYRYYSEWHQDRHRFRLERATLLQWDDKLEDGLKNRPTGNGFWLVFSHLVSQESLDKRNRLKEEARQYGTEERGFEAKGAAAYWYEMKD